MDTPIRLFATSLDGTLIGNPASTAMFIRTWDHLPADRRPLLCYNTSRQVEDIEPYVQNGQIPEPDFVIGGVGTQIVNWQHKSVADEYVRTIADGWDREQIEDIVEHVPGIEPRRVDDDRQTPYKSSWILPNAPAETIQTIERQLADAGIRCQVLYSFNHDLDVLPTGADKGHALEWLCQREQIPLEQVLVAGDRATEASMYLLPGVRGILIENAQPELYEAVMHGRVYHTTRAFAEGLIDGLIHYGVIEQLPKPKTRVSLAPVDPDLRLLFEPEYLRGLGPDDQLFLAEAYQKAVEALRKNITPIGFSACSLTDNVTSGTDANYRSVWGRDGAITIVNTAAMPDDDIRACQRNTLETLLAATTENGQVPANVRIDTGEPDYSGVGGICAVDSGIWLIIAVYHYANNTGDTDFLEEHQGKLEAIMNWLQAHDSNRDGLLEIPEASDWTDLFGRSYNVLYDEVLWYRANVCYAYILEMRRLFTDAAAVMGRSQQIRGKLLSTFWPTLNRGDDALKTTFADTQFGLGDAQYLLAEVSPFSFNWRCDVFGNVLAGLMNVFDAEHGRTALSFMWGCGVNEPWPVANLYPVVQAGDPDWRSYYTVNLLNLPHHYHNGGIWPMVGGMWVRFIHRLGQQEVASRELVRLAQCCKQGRYHEWEFNEWYHGQTGRPMGKAFQAWSAAAFIRACHDLQVIDPEELSHD